MLGRRDWGLCFYLAFPFSVYPWHPCLLFSGMQAETPERVFPAVERARPQRPHQVSQRAAWPLTPLSALPHLPACCLCQLPVLLQCLILALNVSSLTKPSCLLPP